MYDREISYDMERLSRQFPVLVITGPRQSGKTTLAKLLFKNKKYVSMEDPDNRNFVLRDPRGFLNEYPNGAIIDEVQRTPEILSYIQTKVDEKSKELSFILTGSQQFELMQKISQSLAGRVAVTRLLPLSY